MTQRYSQEVNCSKMTQRYRTRGQRSKRTQRYSLTGPGVKEAKGTQRYSLTDPGIKEAKGTQRYSLCNESKKLMDPVVLAYRTRSKVERKNPEGIFVSRQIPP